MLFLHTTCLEKEDNKCLLEKIYDNYKNIMYNVAFNILKDEFLSEDAVHNSFLSISKNMKKISDISEQGDKNLRNYLIIIAKNAALAIKNDQKRFITLNDLYNKEDSSNQYNIEMEIENNELQEKLFELIKTLDEKYSDVLILKSYYEMKNSEIAKQLGITKGNVNTRYVKAKNMLKELMEKEGIYNGQKI